MSISLNRTTLLFGLCCLGYLLVAPSTPPEFSALLKIIPIILLSFLVVRAGINSVSLHLLLALLFSMGGDVLLEMNLFVPGLSSFLFAQLLYGSLFLRYHSSWSADYQISLLFVGAFGDGRYHVELRWRHAASRYRLSSGNHFYGPQCQHIYHQGRHPRRCRLYSFGFHHSHRSIRDGGSCFGLVDNDQLLCRPVFVGGSGNTGNAIKKRG